MEIHLTPDEIGTFLQRVMGIEVHDLKISENSLTFKTTLPALLNAVQYETPVAKSEEFTKQMVKEVAQPTVEEMDAVVAASRALSDDYVLEYLPNGDRIQRRRMGQ